MRTMNEMLGQAEQIIERLDGTTYASDFQVGYEDRAHLAAVISRMSHEIGGITTVAQIQSLSDQLALIAGGIDDRSILITGNCSERVSDPQHATIPTAESIAGIELVQKSIIGNNVLHIRRERGQNTKPRSEANEIIDGMAVPSYMGDAINSPDLAARTPDPERLAQAAMQAVMLERNLTSFFGEHIPAAHEALNLYYEQAFLHETDDGKQYLLSADLPWIGVRTNGGDSLQVDLLASIENSVGVKIGPTTTREHIAHLSHRLNPTRRIGKVAWMLRIGLDNPEISKEIIQAIIAVEDEPIIMYDIHGSTVKRQDGAKIRAVTRINDEIAQLHSICRDAGTKLHGLHLETTVRDRFECVDEPSQTPTHEGGIDPQLNQRQTIDVITRFSHLGASTL